MPVTLPLAVEFRSAMRMLNIMTPAEEIVCVRRHKLSVFIASAPLSNVDKQEKVCAQLYAFARHSLFKNDVFERYIGRQTLCLDAGEYECAVEKMKKEEALRESVAIAAQKRRDQGPFLSCVAAWFFRDALNARAHPVLQTTLPLQTAACIQRLSVRCRSFPLPAFSRLLACVSEPAFRAELDFLTRLRAIPAQGNDIAVDQILHQRIPLRLF